MDSLIGRAHAAPSDINARQREQLEVIDNPATDRIVRENLVEAFLNEFPPEVRLRDFVPNSDTIREIYKRCSPVDSRDASAVALADAQRERYSRMFPTLFPRPAQVESARQQYSLDPDAARAALAQHLRKMSAINAKIAHLLSTEHAAGDLAAQAAQVQARLDAIEAEEREAWSVWAAHPSSPRPQPHAAEKGDLIAEHRQLQQQAASAQAAADRQRPAYIEAVAELQRLTEGRDPLIAAVLGTELPRLLAQKHQADLQMNRLCGAIDQLRRSLNALDGSNTDSVFEAATPDSREQSHARCRSAADASRQHVKQWTEALCVDAGAVLDTEDE